MKMKKIIKRIGLCFVGLCAMVFPTLMAHSVFASAQSVADLPGTDMNGAVLLTETTKYLSSQSYVTALDNGFNTNDAQRGYALKKGNTGTPFASFYINTLGDGGSVYKGAKAYYGYDAYGFIAGSGEPIYRYDEETAQDQLVGYNSIAINIKYNYSTSVGLDGTDGQKWDICDDTWKGKVNGMDSVGVVGKGAVIVQKFVPTEEKQAPESASDWKRLNEFSGEETDGLHTVDFFGQYTPEKKYGQPFAVYTPSGKDLQSGVFIKLTVAYELVHDDPYKSWFTTKHSYTYKNVVEETVFYLCNTSGEVVFTNLYYAEQSGEGEETPGGETGSTAGVEQKGGEISNNQGAVDGFRADINGWNYDVTYQFNGSTNFFPCVDGQVFLEPGRYDFFIKTKIGVQRKKTVYIHERTPDANLKAYFGESLFSSDSMRVFTPSETYPVFVKGNITLQTQDENASLIKRAPLVGRVYRFDEDWESIERDENGLPLKQLQATKSADNHAWAFSNLPAGRYEAVFANNEDFFNGTATGDTYKFVWRFTVVDEGFVPFVNQENLYQLIGFSDYASLHYVTVLPSRGDGNVLVTFADETSAYNFASKYLASTVQVSEGKYYFDYAVYETEAALLEKLHAKAWTLVEKRYFNPLDVTTYLSLNEDMTKPILSDDPSESEQEFFDSYIDILNQSLAYDIVVFADEYGREDLAVGEPFLNDKMYAYINNGGEIVFEKQVFKFISVADFESNSIVLQPEGTDLEYTIPYGVAVQDYLIRLGAPSGRYLIKESNAWGDSEYYAVYIRPGDIRSSIKIERLYNSNYSVLTLGKLNDGQHIRANYFKITDIANQLDPYGLIKIKKDGEEMATYQIDEADALMAFDQEGNYEIVLIDRLGNSMTLYVDIYNSERVYTLTYLNGSKEISSEVAYGGKEFTLPVLTTEDKKFEFYGWQDENGNVYTDTYLFTKPEDVKLYAVWHYASVDISIYDGELVKKLLSKVGSLEDELPDDSLQKQGYTLYGYRYVLEDGTIRIYRNQISSVPNVEKMRLDAIWVRDENLTEPLEQGAGGTVKVSLVDGSLYETLTIGMADVVQLPKLEDRDGMLFLGWLYEYKLTGIIFNDAFSCVDLGTIGVKDKNALTLTAVWITSTEAEPTSTTPNVAGIIGNNLVHGLGLGESVASFKRGGFISAIFTVLFAIALLCSEKFAWGATQNAGVKGVNANAKAYERSVGAKKVRLKKVRTSRRRGFSIRNLYKAVLVPCICFLLSALYVFDASSGFISALAQKADAPEQETISDVYDGAVSLRDEQLDLALTSIQSSLSKNGNGAEALTESEEFLYSNIIVDLLSMGYEDVFTAYAVVGANTPETYDDKVVEGIGYTAYVDAYEEDDGYIFGAGFVSLADENYITQEDYEQGVVIQIAEDEADDYEYTEFKLTFNQVWGPLHYVAYGNYVQYQVADYVVLYSIAPDVGEYIDAYGDVYSYDMGDYCHYVNYGETFEFDAFGLSSDVDYDEILQFYRESIEEQMRVSVNIDVAQADFISVQALNDYVVQGQDERFLGIDAETLLYYEANIEDTQYYIIYEDGTVGVLELPPDPAEKATIWERIWMGLISGLGMVAGIVACVIPGVGPTISGALLGASIDLFTQTVIMGVPPKDIDWKSVLASAVVGGITGVLGQVGNALTKVALSTAKSAISKILITLGTEAVAGLVSGTATYFVGIGIRGDAFSWDECFSAVGMGLLASALACLGGALGGKVIDRLTKTSTALNVALQIAGGALLSMGRYTLSLIITGAEFSVEGLFIAAAMGAATATLKVIGGKIISKIKSARIKRLEKDDLSRLQERINKGLPAGEDGDAWYYTDKDGNRISKQDLLDDPYQQAYLVSSKDSNVKLEIVEGYPQQAAISVGTVSVEDGITLKRRGAGGNFDMFDERLADTWSTNHDLIPDDIKAYFKNDLGVDNLDDLSMRDIRTLRSSKVGMGYTWHESEDMHTAYLVKTDVHRSIKHNGGIEKLKFLLTTEQYQKLEKLKMYNALKKVTYPGG